MVGIFITTILFSMMSFGAVERPSLAIILNRTMVTPTTQNPIENYVLKGTQLAVKNAVLIDEGQSTETTLNVIEELNRLKPQVAVGLGNSAQVLLAAERMNAQTVLISPVATSDEILKKKANIILLSNPNSAQAAILADQMIAAFKPSQQILILNLAGCPYCSDLAEAVSQRLTKRGITFQTVRLHVSQLTEAVASINGLKNFNHILVPALEAESARLIEMLYPKNKDAVFYGGDGWGTLARFVRELSFAKSVHVLWLANYHESIDTEENRAFVKAYRNAYGAAPIDTSALYYESVLIAQKIRRPTAAATMKAFATMGTFQSLTGPARIKGRYVLRPMPLMTLEDGHIKVSRMVTPGSEP